MKRLLLLAFTMTGITNAVGRIEISRKSVGNYITFDTAKIKGTKFYPMLVEAAAYSKWSMDYLGKEVSEWFTVAEFENKKAAPSGKYYVVYVKEGASLEGLVPFISPGSDYTLEP